MIPPRMLQRLAEGLIRRTQADQDRWTRERQDLQRYVLQLKSGGKIVLHYSPSRGGTDTIELAVTGPTGEVIGSIVAEENESPYDVLADLLFEIQLKIDPGMHRAVTDEILGLMKTS
jgi:hypothetical protein